MSDHFKYFLKPEERRSLQIKKKSTRKWNVILTLSNVALLMLIFFLVYKPAMERLENERKFYIDDFSIEIDWEMTEKGVFVDLYIFNTKEDRYFDFSKLYCSLILLDGNEIYPLNKNTEKKIIERQKGIHIINSYSSNEYLNKETGFFIRVKYDDKVMYESKIIKYNY